MSKTELIKEYIEQVRHNIYNLYPADDFLSALRSDLEEYTTQFPECNFDDLIEQFGTPEMVARDFLSNADTDSPRTKAQKKKLKLTLWICTLLIIAILGTLCIIAATQRQVMFEDVTTILDSE